MTTTALIRDTDGPVHTWFGLSYSNYQVLPRTLMQSMPTEWQERMVACLDELSDAFQHIENAEAYKVDAAEEHVVSEMTEAQLEYVGITEDWYGGETPPEGLTGEALDEWQNQHQRMRPDYYDAEGNELDSDSRVLVPADDPVPHYNRGRTYIEPRLPAAASSAPVDRAARWEAAAHAAGREVDRNALAAYMAVADAEQEHWAAYEVRLRQQHDLDVAELNRLRARVADRGAVLREAADVLDTLPAAASSFDKAEHKYKGGAAAERLRRMADEAQQPEAQADAVPARVSLTRNQLAALLAHHADVLAARWYAVAPGAGAWEIAASLSLTSHANELTADEETPAVAELLDSILTFPGEQAEHQPEAAPVSIHDPDVVAYRSKGGQVLRCLRHRPDVDTFRNGDMHPVTAEDLEDGGICTYSDCGADVLIPQQPEAAEGAQR